MSMSLHWFGVSRLQTELLGWAAKLTPLVQDRPDLRAAVDSSIAYRYVIASNSTSARQRARNALADAADDQTRCRALEALGDSCIFQGDLDQAHSWWSELAKVAAARRDLLRTDRPRRGGHVVGVRGPGGCGAQVSRRG